MEQETKRTLHQIAKEICEDHDKQGKLLHYTLVPYVDAMLQIHSSDPEATYIYDDARTIVMYFLANASVWKGETARRIKNELKTNYKIK